MGNLAPHEINGPNRPWEHEIPHSFETPTEDQLLEFYTMMRPLTALDHEVAGRASLLPEEDGRTIRLRPTFIINGDGTRIRPETCDRVAEGRADCYFHTHPASYVNETLGPYADCWPSMPDLVHSLGILSAFPDLYADLIVTRCVLVVVTRSADFHSWIASDSSEEAVTRAQYAVVQRLQREQDTPTPDRLRQVLETLHLSLHWIKAPEVRDAGQVVGASSRTTLHADAEYLECFRDHMQKKHWLTDDDDPLRGAK